MSRDGFFHPTVEPVATAIGRLNLDFTVVSETHDSQEEGALALKRAVTGENYVTSAA